MRCVGAVPTLHDLSIFNMVASPDSVGKFARRCARNPRYIGRICPPYALILFTISMARRSSVIEASGVRNAACALNVTFAMPASG
jgi:hypothetical protein